MAARLEWKDAGLMLGPWTLAIFGTAPPKDLWRFAIPDADSGVSDPYEKMEDAMRDCESEVRRLLKEAGIEVET